MLFENNLNELLSQIISETPQTPIKFLLQLFEENRSINSNISLLRLGNNISTGLPNTTESQKKSVNHVQAL